MKRKVWIGTGFLALIGGLLVAQGILGRAAIVEAQGKPQAPRFEVDPFWPKPLPNHWVLGQTIGVWVDAQDNVWIVHRGSGTLDDNEKGLELKIAECCAGAPPVLVFDRRGNLVRQLGRPGTGLRLAVVEPRHLRRSRRQRVDRRQRPGRLAHREVHQGRQVPGAVRQARRARERQGRAGQADVRRGQQRPGELRPRREDLRRSQGERGLHRRRLLQQPRRGARRRRAAR